MMFDLFTTLLSGAWSSAFPEPFRAHLILCDQLLCPKMSPCRNPVVGVGGWSIAWRLHRTYLNKFCIPCGKKFRPEVVMLGEFVI